MADLAPYQDERAIKDETAILNLVNQRFDLSKTYREGFDASFDKKYQYYRSYVKQDPEYWYRYQLFLPYIFSMVESISPDFVSALIGGDEFFSIRSNKQSRVQSDNITKLMKYQIDEKMQFYLKILMWIKSILIFGNGIMYTGWRKKSRTFTQKEYIQNALLGLVGSVKVKRTEDIVNDPYIDTVFIKNFYPQPHKECVKDMGWCIERAFVDWDFIQSLKNAGIEKNSVWKNLDGIKESKSPSDYKSVMEEMNTLVGIASATTEDPINKPVELLKYWRTDRLVIVANRKVVIRDSDNPFEHGEIPYDDAKDYPLDKEFYAISDVDLLIPLQDICNDMTNYRLDNLVDLINTSYIASRNKGINPDDIISRPSGVIWSDDTTGIAPIAKAPIPQAAYLEPETMYKAMQRACGAWEYAQGATPERSETATGIIKLQQAALKRFGYRIKLLQRTGFKDILTKIMQLDQQLLPVDYTMRVFNEQMDIKLSPWDIAGKFSINVSGSTNLVGLEERMMQIWSQAKNDQYFDQLELRKRMLDIMDIPASDKLLKQASGLLGLAQGGMQGGGANPLLGIISALKGGGVPGAAPEKKPSESINFKDLPPEGKVQMAAQAGIKINPPVPPLAGIVNALRNTKPQGVPVG